MDNYKILEETVWNKNLCTCCGACSAVCPSSSIIYKNFQPSYIGKCKVLDSGIPCGACSESCARVKKPDPVNTQYQAYSVRSANPVPNAQSGGAVTQLLISALDSGMIDGALLMNVDKFTQKPSPIIATDRNMIMLSAGSRYTWGNVLDTLGKAVKKGHKNLAIVGTPCTIQSVRRIMASNVDVVQCYGRCIRFTIGVFCSGIFGEIENIVAKKLGISSWQIKKIDIKSGKVIVFLKDGVMELAINSVKDNTLPGCSKCSDFASDYADISAGKTGSEDGHTSILVRNEAGNALVSCAFEMGNITMSEKVDIDSIQKASERKINSAMRMIPQV
ncbi:MAG: Coenzyme F420 hydrogenase/dehydrogenase, beta subunit C-terminal domain [Candidatus Methanoperedens sp.]|nr:Coenzyme F420 hydrogenase/dehydrogenase, beta subunit C-terminal domain [Candidatus Methanoperedens sp.]